MGGGGVSTIEYALHWGTKLHRSTLYFVWWDGWEDVDIGRG